MMSFHNAIAGFTPGTTFVFADGYDAPADLCISILSQVEEIVPALDPEATYTLEMLCGPDFWGDLDIGERQQAGRIMTHLCAGGWLPPQVVGCRHEYPRRYRLR